MSKYNHKNLPIYKVFLCIHNYHKLIKRFYEKTGCPVLANTSFNIRGEPIVCSPEDAFRCFMGTDLEVLVIDNFFLKKNNQPSSLKEDYKKQFSLD